MTIEERNMMTLLNLHPKMPRFTLYCRCLVHLKVNSILDHSKFAWNVTFTFIVSKLWFPNECTHLNLVLLQSKNMVQRIWTGVYFTCKETSYPVDARLELHVSVVKMAFGTSFVIWSSRTDEIFVPHLAVTSLSWPHSSPFPIPSLYQTHNVNRRFRVLKTFRRSRGNVTRNYRKLHNKELHNLYSYLD